MKLTEKMAIAVKHFKKLNIDSAMTIDEIGTILKLESLVKAHREARILILEHGDIDIADLNEFTSPISISSNLKLLC